MARYSIEQGPRGLKQLGRGLCPHCAHRVSFVPPPGGPPSWSYRERLPAEHEAEPDTLVEHTFIIGLCPDLDCGKASIVYEVGESLDNVWDSWSLVKLDIVYPPASGRTLADEEIPAELRSLYAEAGRIEGTSPNGAAFLGRRILERVLRTELRGRVKTKTPLARLIDSYLAEETVPPKLHQLMHDVRQFGNIAGHPDESDDGRVLDVDQGEATYVLDVVGELLDYIYIRPKKQEAMRARYEAKSEGRRPGDHVGGGRIKVVPAQPSQSPETFSSDDDDLPF